jgi:hypothetical protein
MVTFTLKLALDASTEKPTRAPLESGTRWMPNRSPAVSHTRGAAFPSHSAVDTGRPWM